MVLLIDKPSDVSNKEGTICNAELFPNMYSSIRIRRKLAYINGVIHNRK